MRSFSDVRGNGGKPADLSDFQDASIWHAEIMNETFLQYFLKLYHIEISNRDINYNLYKFSSSTLTLVFVTSTMLDTSKKDHTFQFGFDSYTNSYIWFKMFFMALPEFASLWQAKTLFVINFNFIE